MTVLYRRICRNSWGVGSWTDISQGKLAGFFSDPENWAQVSDEDKDFIRSLLPPTVELNDDGSIPTEFWKYNPEFRLDCRNLQEDLRAGRMDPEWQRQAHQAMEERAAGKFDNFKEREFEEFWGQKQKVDWKVLAGDASQVKLDEMLKAGLFKAGDVWSFDHTFGKGENAVRIQKDCRVGSPAGVLDVGLSKQIIQIKGKTISFAIPPGTLRFARRIAQAISSNYDTAMTDSKSAIPSVFENDAVKDAKMGEATVEDNEAKIKGTQTELADRTDEKKSLDETDHEQASSLQAVAPCEGSPTTSSELSSIVPSTVHGEVTSSIPEANESLHPLSATDEYDVIPFSTSGLLALEKKILQIDGRAKPGSRLVALGEIYDATATSRIWVAFSRCAMNTMPITSLRGTIRLRNVLGNVIL